VEKTLCYLKIVDLPRQTGGAGFSLQRSLLHRRCKREQSYHDMAYSTCESASPVRKEMEQFLQQAWLEA
jgi:hypothetical protein